MGHITLFVVLLRCWFVTYIYFVLFLLVHIIVIIHRDVSIPPGCLYFSLPCFFRGGGNADPSNILFSTKEGIISVRQIGWHTGWRREESRIVGIFRAVPIEKAQRIDGY